MTLHTQFNEALGNRLERFHNGGARVMAFDGGWLGRFSWENACPGGCGHGAKYAQGTTFAAFSRKTIAHHLFMGGGLSEVSEASVSR
jgi:hypothetical protein